MSLKTLTLIATSYFIISISHAEVPKLDRGTALQAIQEYKILRSECAQAIGDERKACFAKLSATTKVYKRAKQFIDKSGADKNQEVANLADNNNL